MILKIYVIGIIAIMIAWVLLLILGCVAKDIENKRFDLFLKTYFIMFPVGLIGLFFIYNIFVAICLPSGLKWGAITFIAMCIFAIITFLIPIIQEKYNSSVLELISGLTLILTVISIFIYLMWIMNLAFGSDSEMPGTIEKRYEKDTIEIVEMEQVPYANTSGNRWYIRSAPSFAYYYKVRTKSGNTTTKVLDGSRYYIEEDVDNQYQDNPHIEVMDTVEKYQTIYGKEKERIAKREYIICVPEDGIYYEGK